MRILVTGGAGFIGSHIVEAYIAAGHTVTVVDDLSAGKREYVPAGATFYQMDIRDPQLSQVFEAEQPEVVNHQAALVSVPRSLADPVENTLVNVAGLVNVLEQARRHDVRQVIFASSCAVYGDPEHLPIREDHPISPLSPYGQSKWTGEHYLDLYRRMYGLSFAALRYSNVYGPRQDPFGEAGVVTIFVEKMLAGMPVTIFDDGEQTRDFIYVGDVAKANLRALDLGDNGVYNISTGQAVTINQLFETLRQQTSYNREPRYDAPRPGDIRHSVLDPARAVRDLDWHPEMPFEEGLAQTIEFFRA
ncbi:MAG: NAD-dependent epimerase/dehydratase family protein [Chloroflexi bacterium]|nr:MAG: NAD-dependent epimerase/dehydratase family protein [Chloroflexota bacterium]